MWKISHMRCNGSYCGKENTDEIPLLPLIIETQPIQPLFPLMYDLILKKMFLSVAHFGCTGLMFQAPAANFRDVKSCFVPSGRLFIAYLVKVMSSCIFLASEQSLYLPIAFGFSEPADGAGLLKFKEEAM